MTKRHDGRTAGDRSVLTALHWRSRISHRKRIHDSYARKGCFACLLLRPPMLGSRDTHWAPLLP